MNKLIVKRSRNTVDAKLKHRRAKPIAAVGDSTKIKLGFEEQIQKPKSTASPRKPAGQRFTCLVCGRKYRSLIELRAHKKRNPGRHVRPPVKVAKSATAVKQIGSIPHQGYRGHRATNRSS